MVTRSSVPTTYGGRESGFGFVAVFRSENEVVLEKNNSVGYKADFRFLVIPRLHTDTSGLLLEIWSV